MPAFLARSNLSRGDLTLYLTNDLGYAQDGYNVRWSVFSKDGIPVSGTKIPAIKASTGEYYAPWCSKAANGCYDIVWEYQEYPGAPVEQIKENFFIIEPSAYQCCPNFVCGSQSTDPGCSTFFVGSLLGRGDLPLFLKNGDGVPTDAFAVYWQIFDCNGCPVTSRTEATSGSDVGEYYASWFVNVLGGSFTIKWDWIESADSPLSAKSMEFAVISPTALFYMRNGVCLAAAANPCSPCLIPYIATSSCCSSAIIPYSACSAPCTYSPVPSPVSPIVTEKCCAFEIPRVVHLVTQNLPAGGAYTNQPSYTIPTQIRKIAFYISYSRGIANGQAIFRLLWGNGVEETQSTLLSTDYSEYTTAISNQDMFLQDLKGPIPTDGNPVKFTIETTVPGGAKTVRLLAAECGMVGAPGIISITLTASS